MCGHVSVFRRRREDERASPKRMRRSFFFLPVVADAAVAADHDGGGAVVGGGALSTRHAPGRSSSGALTASAPLSSKPPTTPPHSAPARAVLRRSRSRRTSAARGSARRAPRGARPRLRRCRRALHWPGTRDAVDARDKRRAQEQYGRAVHRGGARGALTGGPLAAAVAAARGRRRRVGGRECELGLGLDDRELAGERAACARRVGRGDVGAEQHRRSHRRRGTVGTRTSPCTSPARCVTNEPASRAASPRVSYAERAAVCRRAVGERRHGEVAAEVMIF